MPSDNDAKIEALEQELKELRDKVAEYEASIAQLQNGFTQLQGVVTNAMDRVADVAATQSRQFVRMVEAVDEISDNQKAIIAQQDGFERWRREISTPLKVPSMRKDDNAANELATLERALREYFNEQELRDLMVDVNIDTLLIAGSTHADKCHELVGYARRHGLIDKLAKRASELRPHALIIPDTGPLQ